MLVKDWMTINAFSVTPEDSFSTAVAMVKDNKVKHLPVVDASHHVVGILSDRDIKEFAPSKATTLDIYELNYLLEKTTVKEVMKKKVLTATPDMPVEDAARIMHDQNVGCLPVVENNKLVGIISDNDIYEVLIEITGVRRGGLRVSLTINDEPGSIKVVADIIRKHGFRLLSILSSHEKAGPGQRYVVLRAFGPSDAKALEQELKASFGLVRFMDFR
jgi:acetoin utilization protein AcuB